MYAREIIKFTNKQIEEKLGAAVRTLKERDEFLLRHDAHERSVAHKLAEYLQNEFGDDRHVDCEYDLHGQLLKQLDGIQECAEERRTDRIYPDIIVHVRDTDEFNTLVVEVKVRRQSVDCDLMKLALMTKAGGQYRYQGGVLLQFNGLDDPHRRWFWRQQSRRRK